MLNNIVPDIKSCNNTKPFDCHICPLAKQHRFPFTHSSSISLSCFDLVHADIWGPYSTPSLNGSKYFLTLVDDHSRCTWVYLLKHKFDTSTLIPSFFHMILTQFKVPIKVFRSNNGLEFALSSFYASKGIINQLSYVETSQQNAVVERKHRLLLNVARALRFQANLPLKFWGDCVLTATYLINRLPSPLLQNLTPYEKLLGHPPTYDHLKSFGSLCYASILTRQRTKFDPKAKACVFIGYPFGTEGYKLYDLAFKTVFLSRDVIFKEFIFPFKHWTSKPIISSTSNSSVIFPPQNSVPDIPPTISAEFSLPFSSVDPIVPPDEFPDLMHSDSAHSPYVLVNFLILFLLLYPSYHLLEDLLGLINHLFIFMTIIVILHLLMCWPLFLYLNLMILLFLLMCQWSSLPNSVVQWVRMFLILPCTEG